MTAFNEIGIAVPDILFPSEGTDLTKWATIACDQFTAQPEYWEAVRAEVGSAPSTLFMQMPEAWLGKEPAHEASIPNVMKAYLSEGTLTQLPEGFMFIKRQTSSGMRRGLLALIDLEQYEYAPGNKALIRATEGTVESRLPVRVEIRKKAPLEMPHIMVLFSDPKESLMGSLEILTRNRRPLYDFRLMQNGGNIKGFLLSKESDWNTVAGLFGDLKASAPDGMLFAVGDGNHSLAAAKKIWEKEKHEPAPDIRKRYAMAELVNLYDPALRFEPIHRLIKDGRVIDYIHGAADCITLARKMNCQADIRPDYPKEKLFADIIEKGVLPKKTFSIGRAPDKRYYLECRRL